MIVQCEIPEPVRRSLAERLPDDHEGRYAARSDLDANRHFGEPYVIVRGGPLVTAGPRAVLTALPLSAVKELRVDELFGSARLVAVLDRAGEGGPETQLAYYSKAHVPEFGLLCRVVSDLCRGKTPPSPEPTGAIECLKCGLPLPERGARCPACVPRMAVLFRLLRLLKPYRSRLWLLMAMTFVAVGAQMGPPYITKRIVDDVIRPQDVSSLGYWITGMVACGLIYLVAHCAQGFLSAWLASRLTADLRSSVHAHLQRLRLSYFGKREAGEIVARTMRDTGRLQHFLIDGLPFLLVNLVAFVAIAAILLSLDVWLALPA